uniref:Uncharacterized protein n=1 Tax=viral metagenome TaxID=1070528 RepID=A0A6C0ASV1_9ZZZZ
MHLDDTAQHVQHVFEMRCAQGDVRGMRHVLESRLGHLVDVHVDDCAPFHMACATNRSAAVRFMLSLQGVQRIEDVRVLRAALEHACQHGLLHTATELLRCTGGRRLPLDDNECAPFVQACTHGHLHVAQLLLGVADGRVAATPSAVSAAFSQCVRKRLYTVTRFLKDLNRDGCFAARVRKISLHRAAKQPMHALCSGSRKSTAPYLGATPPLVRCEPQDPPSAQQIRAAVQRHAGLLINAPTSLGAETVHPPPLTRRSVAAAPLPLSIVPVCPPSPQRVSSKLSTVCSAPSYFTPPRAKRKRHNECPQIQNGRHPRQAEA